MLPALVHQALEAIFFEDINAAYLLAYIRKPASAAWHKPRTCV